MNPFLNRVVWDNANRHKTLNVTDVDRIRERTTTVLILSIAVWLFTNPAALAPTLTLMAVIAGWVWMQRTQDFTIILNSDMLLNDAGWQDSGKEHALLKLAEYASQHANENQTIINRLYRHFNVLRWGFVAHLTVTALTTLLTGP